MIASLLGGVLTFMILRFRLMPLPAVLAEQEWAKRLHRMDTGIPYGIALALAALAIYPDTPWMKLGMRRRAATARLKHSRTRAAARRRSAFPRSAQTCAISAFRAQQSVSSN